MKNVFPQTLRQNFFIIMLLLINTVIRIPLRTYPPTGDAILYYEGALRIFHNHLNPFIEFYSYKPPFQFELTAIVWKIVGPSIISGNIIVYIFSTLALLYTYLLGKKLYSAKIGFISALLLSFSPLFMAQSMHFVDTVFFITFFMASLYYYFSSKISYYLIATSLLVLIKEPASLIPIMITIFHILRSYDQTQIPKATLVKQSLILVSPLSLLLLWIIMNKILLGWYIWPISIQSVVFSVERIQWVFWEIISRDCLFIFIGWSLIGIYFLWKKSHTLRYVFLLYISLFLLYAFGYSLIFQPRYIVPLYPLLFIMTSITIDQLFRSIVVKNLLYSLLLILLLCVHIVYIFYKPITWQGDNDLNILRTISLEQRSVQYIHASYPQALITSSFAINRWLDTTFESTSNHNIIQWYYWEGTDVEKTKSVVIAYATQKNLYPIFFIESSYQPYLLNVRSVPKEFTLVTRIYDQSGDKRNYFDIYRIE